MAFNIWKFFYNLLNNLNSLLNSNNFNNRLFMGTYMYLCAHLERNTLRAF